ncbi:hypothetical protein SLEP1_g205 [Rubroshorea leprosula]|uniref:CASP-like protein n=1 Tax=Rubroshorea leprosula TaxID=152421 RepID=A0AAV5HK71_9ROSI|nr:hypothetical protein SLEP1_g205 [Rubroshorea leprosula]
MASIDKPDPEVPTKLVASEGAPPLPPPPAPPCKVDYFAVDVALRVWLFAAAVTSVVVMVTSEETEVVPVPGVPNHILPLPAKFNHSPAFIYFVAALSVAGLYSIITALASISVLLKPDFSKTFLLHFAFLDLLMLGVVASAVGAAGAVGYIGLKGNSHVGWSKECSVYKKFCTHVGSSIAVALFAAVLLVLLSMLSISSLHRRIRD